MQIGIPKEIHQGECRVAATPQTVRRLCALGFQVAVQAGAGALARYPDQAYVQAGASLVHDVDMLWASSDIIIKVNPPEALQDGGHETKRLKLGGTLVSMVYPAQNQDLVHQLAERQATVLALDRIPRISRAQKMDVLSSMANIAGYRAVIEAANHFGCFFTGQITAAGKTPPAVVLVIGAGVAGLAAIAAARSLGAVVRAFDTRPVVKEQVQSLGAQFLEVDLDEDGTGQGGYAKTMSPAFIAAEMALFRAQCAEVDIIITTALIPGKTAPVLITYDMLSLLKPGSVVVDLAARNGGNCEACVPGQVVEVDGVTIVGLTDLTSRLPTHASQFFGTNVVHFIDEMTVDGTFQVNLDNEIVRGALVLLQGEVPPPAAAPPPAQPANPAAAPQTEPSKPLGSPPEATTPAPGSSWGGYLAGLVGLACFGAVAAYAPPEFIQHVTVFCLACVVGYQVVWNVTPALHTPLMSVTNAISGIIIVGGLLTATAGPLQAAAWVGLVAIVVASINVFGGFLVTHRMLQMFKRKEHP